MSIGVVGFLPSSGGTSFLGLFTSSQVTASRAIAKDFTGPGDLKTFFYSFVGFLHGWPVELKAKSLIQDDSFNL